VSTLTLELAGGRTRFAPGDAIAGTVAWSAPSAPGPIELRLFWYTQGKGTRDVGIETTRRIEAVTPEGREDFSLVAPAHPPSIAGTLVSVCWALELVGADDVPRIDLVIGPGGRAVVLGSV
jgi:hypothetical protein